MALIITILGLFALLILLNRLPLKEIKTLDDLNKTEENQKVFVNGKVIDERIYETSKILILDNQIPVTCKGCPSYINKSTSIIGKIDNYNNKNKIIALKINTLE